MHGFVTNFFKMLVSCTLYGISVISSSSWIFLALRFGDVNNLMSLGTLAAKYEKLGGEVKWMGKPDKVI